MLILGLLIEVIYLLKHMIDFLYSVNKKKLFGFFILLLIVAAIPLTVFIARQQQDIRQRADYYRPPLPQTPGYETEYSITTSPGQTSGKVAVLVQAKNHRGPGSYPNVAMIIDGQITWMDGEWRAGRELDPGTHDFQLIANCDYTNIEACSSDPARIVFNPIIYNIPSPTSSAPTATPTPNLSSFCPTITWNNPSTVSSTQSFTVSITTRGGSEQYSTLLIDNQTRAEPSGHNTWTIPALKPGHHTLYYRIRDNRYYPGNEFPDGGINCATTGVQSVAPTNTVTPTPGVPGNFQVRCSENNANLSWIAPSDAVSGQQYQIQYNGHFWTTTDRSYTVPLDNNARVNASVSVRPINTTSFATGTINCPIATNTPIPTVLPPPTNLQATCTYLSGGLQVNYSWNYVPGAASYRLEWNGNRYSASQQTNPSYAIGGSPTGNVSWAWSVRAVASDGTLGTITGGTWRCPAVTNTPTPTVVPPTATTIPPVSPTIPLCTRTKGGYNAPCIAETLGYDFWKQEVIKSNPSSHADYNGDNTVDILDFNLWRLRRY